MYQPTDLKKGVVCQIDSKPYRVVEYGQKVMGRGGSIVNVKLKNLIDGSVIPKTFKGQERIEAAEVNNKTAQYLYNDGDKFYFMDPVSFEQFELAAEIVDDASKYLKEGDELSLQFFDGRVINVELPKNKYLEVTYTEDVVKGDTTSSVLKDATLETGLVVKVPAFIKQGDIISVDTSTGEYRERKKQSYLMKQRLDKALVERGLVTTRSQADNFIRLGYVFLNKKIVQKSGTMVSDSDEIKLEKKETYVSRAGLKLASVAEYFHLNFQDKIVLDIGSSTGGFTDYSLRHGAKKVFAIDVGTDQLHPSLRPNPKIALHEKTDIRDFYADESIDIIVGDVSFISLREILPHVAENLMNTNTILIAMVKPQFEAGRHQVNKGIIKNDKVRRQILSDFEDWAKKYFVILDKKDSEVAGSKGNLERFYKLKLSRR